MTSRLTPEQIAEIKARHEADEKSLASAEYFENADEWAMDVGSAAHKQRAALISHIESDGWQQRRPCVYCDRCEKVRPAIYDHMEANDLNDHDCTDIVCGKCHLVLATLHAPPETKGG